ncbi:MAG: PfkB family carbohydrate kinase [Candidatus Omnitrophota bacterium]
MSLLVLGTVALDDIQTSNGVKQDLLGGSASHFAMSASLFSEVHLVGVVGKDFPKRHFKLFDLKRINVESVQIKEGKTFHWVGQYDARDWNRAVTLETQLGVLDGYEPCITEEQARMKYVFLANDDPEVQMTLLKKMKKPRFVGMDSMNLWIELKKDALLRLIKCVDLFVANDSEAKMLTGELNLIKAARELRKLGPRFVVIKKGEHGVIFFCDRFLFSFPAYPIDRVIDPTGAGDTFAGGLMGYLARTGTLTCDNFKRACLYGTTCSSFNVEGYGVSKTAPLTLADVHARLRKLDKFIKPV